MPGQFCTHSTALCACEYSIVSPWIYWLFNPPPAVIWEPCADGCKMFVNAHFMHASQVMCISPQGLQVATCARTCDSV